MSADRRRLLYRAERSFSTETEPDSVFYDNPAYVRDLDEKPKVHGKHNHVSWDIDENKGQGHHGHSKGHSKSRDDSRSKSRSSRISSGYGSRYSNETIDEVFDDHGNRHISDNDRRSNKKFPPEQSDKLQNGTGKYQDRNSNIVFDPGPRRKDTVKQGSWKKHYREGGAVYVTVESDDSSGYPSSGTFRQDGGSVTVGRGAGDRRRSFSLSPQSSDERARAPYQNPSPRSRSPMGDRLTVEAAVHWPTGSPFSYGKDDFRVPSTSVDQDRLSPNTRRKDNYDGTSSHSQIRNSGRSPHSMSVNGDLQISPYTTRKDYGRSSPSVSRKDYERASPSPSRRDYERASPSPSRRDYERVSPSPSRRDYDRASPSPSRRDYERASPSPSRKDYERASPSPSRRDYERASPSPSRRDYDRGSEHDRRSSPSILRKGYDGNSLDLPGKERERNLSHVRQNDGDLYISPASRNFTLTPGLGFRQSPLSSTSTGGSWRDNASGLSITDSFALQAKAYLMSRKLNDSVTSSGEHSSTTDQNQPLLIMPPGTGSDVGTPFRRAENGVAPTLSILPEEDAPLFCMPPEKELDTVKPHQKVSSTDSGGSMGSAGQHRKLSESASGGSTSLKRDSIIPRRERRDSTIFEDLNLTFRAVSESEFDTDSEFEDGPIAALENGGLLNGSAVIMRDGIERHKKGRGTESPLPITREDTEDMIVMIMSNRSPCVARFILMCGVFQMLCGFVIMMSGASGYLTNMAILSTGETFGFPIGFYIGIFFVFSGGWGIKSSHTKRVCVNVMGALSSGFSLMAAFFILVLIAYPGAIKYSCSSSDKGLYIFHLVCFTVEIIFAGVQTVMCAKSLWESKRAAKHLRKGDTARIGNKGR